MSEGPGMGHHVVLSEQTKPSVTAVLIDGLLFYLHISEEVFYVFKQHGFGYFPAMVSASNK
jgi:hypothetical protein